MAINFNIDKTAANLLDEGDYILIFSDFESKIYKSGTEGLVLNFEVAEGQFQGKSVSLKLWPYSSEGGARMAQVRIAQIAKAKGLAGDLKGESYEDLLNGLVNSVVGAKVVIKEDAQYGSSNDIARFFDKSQVQVPKTTPKPPKAVQKPQEDTYEDDDLV